MPSVDATPSDNKDESELRSIIKSELLREHLQNDSISFNRPIIDWLEKAEQNLEMMKHDGKVGDMDDTVEEMIIVDDIESEGSNEGKLRSSRLNAGSTIEAGKLHLPIDPRFQEESSWITDICRDVQIRLQPEEILEGKGCYWKRSIIFSLINRTFVYFRFRRGISGRTDNACRGVEVIR